MSPEYQNDDNQPITKKDLREFREGMEGWKRNVLFAIACGASVLLLLVGAITFYLTETNESAVREAAAGALIDDVVNERRGCERLDDVRNITYRLLTIAIAAQEGDEELSQTPKQRAEQKESAQLFRGLLVGLIKTTKPRQAIEVTADIKPKDGLPDEIHINCAIAYPFPEFALETVGDDDETLKEIEEQLREEREQERGERQEEESGDRSFDEGSNGSSGSPDETVEPGHGSANDPAASNPDQSDSDAPSSDGKDQPTSPNPGPGSVGGGSPQTNPPFQTGGEPPSNPELPDPDQPNPEGGAEDDGIIGDVVDQATKEICDFNPLDIEVCVKVG